MTNENKETYLRTRINKDEKEKLDNLINNLNTSISDYVREKLFYDNKDFNKPQSKTYVAPESNKDSLLMITTMFKILDLSRIILSKLGCTIEEIDELEDKSMEFARAEREKSGYHIINHEQFDQGSK